MPLSQISYRLWFPVTRATSRACRPSLLAETPNALAFENPLGRNDPDLPQVHRGRHPGLTTKKRARCVSPARLGFSHSSSECERSRFGEKSAPAVSGKIGTWRSIINIVHSAYIF